VPRVKGKTLNGARNAIKSESCRLGKITRAHSRTIRKGYVISQKPRAHLQLPNGAKVSLVISKGRR
jgi:eukaryotic-like serine/threonine-protein kinase